MYVVKQPFYLFNLAAQLPTIIGYSEFWRRMWQQILIIKKKKRQIKSRKKKQITKKSNIPIARSQNVSRKLKTSNIFINKRNIIC